ncbi:MAG: insulinase family protein [Deltaproteobacteria bacterium]|nr:insulinase family protein [Deltaproteobacteria bacterium]
MYQRTVLDNGIRVLTERIPHLHSVSVGVWVDVGSRDESSDEAGLTHFIEHMLFKGTRNRSSLDIAKELDAVGGMSNAFTTKENTCFHAKVLDTHLPLVVDILADILLNSVFAEEEIERERRVILQEINMVEDTPDEYIHLLFSQTYWQGNSLGRSILGTVDTVGNFDREATLRYMQRSYHPERIILSAAGNVDHQEFLKLVEPVFGSLQSHSHNINRQPPEVHPGLELYPRDLEQVHFCLGTRGTSITDEDRYVCNILNVILGGSMSSRLFQKVREQRGLAYAIYSFLTSHTDTGMLGIYGAVSPENAKETLTIIKTELRRLKEEPIQEAELQKAKEHMKGSIYLSAENTDNRMSRLAKSEIHFGRFLTYEEIEAGLDQVTSEQVQQLSRDIFQPGYLALAFLGPVDNLGIDGGFLEI